MNYTPYPYNQWQSQPYQTAQPNYQYNYQPQNQIPQMLNGKLVDSIEVVKATEVPFGSFGIFPKADFSEIYIKHWNNDGTTNVVTFHPKVNETGRETASDTERLSAEIAELRSHIDELLK